MTDIQSLLKKMTLEEKAALCTGASPWTTVSIDHWKIPSMAVADDPHGVRKCSVTYDMGSRCLSATCFPTASCLASTWDRDLLYTLGQAWTYTKSWITIIPYANGSMIRMAGPCLSRY